MADTNEKDPFENLSPFEILRQGFAELDAKRKLKEKPLEGIPLNVPRYQNEATEHIRQGYIQNMEKQRQEQEKLEQEIAKKQQNNE